MFQNRSILPNAFTVGLAETPGTVATTNMEETQISSTTAASFEGFSTSALVSESFCPELTVPVLPKGQGRIAAACRHNLNRGPWP